MPQTKDINGAKLVYDVAGEGHPLVLIHAFTLASPLWDAQFDAFAEQYRVIRYDMRGYGQSSLPDDTPYTHTDDLAALLESLDVETAHIVGISMGGGVAVDFALAYPDKVTSLVACDAGINGYPHWTDDFNATFTVVYEKAAEAGWEAAKPLWLNHPMFEPLRKQPVLDKQLKQLVEAYSGWHFVSKDPQKPFDKPAGERLEQIKVPTFIGVGEHDLPDFHAVARFMHERIEGSQLKVFSGAGHLPNLETPVAFNKAVLDFLEAHTT